MGIQMKRKLVLVLLSVAVLVGLFLVLRRVIPYNAEKLAVPDAVVLDGYTLSWMTVDGASGYELDVDGELRTTWKASVSLRYSDNGKTVRIRALGDGRGFDSSDFGNAFIIDFGDLSSRTDIVHYVLLEARITHTEFVYKDMPVSTAPFDYSYYGYEFLNWYRIVNGSKVDVTADFFYDGVVHLYANVRAKEYPLAFEGGDFELPEGLPDVYTVKTLPEILSREIRSDGYRVSGWCTDKELKRPVESATVVTGALTLYPRISLINEGLRFEITDGGYAVTGYEGEDNEIHIPSFYKGERVLCVRDGALRGVQTSAEGQDVVSEAKSITFHGNILLEEGAIGAFACLERCVFLGNAVVEDGALLFSAFHLAEEVNLVFYKDVDIKAAFFAYYLGVEGGISFKVTVNGENFSRCSAALEGVCEVAAFE